MATRLMVELHQGYGDGYGVVLADDGISVASDRKVTHYIDDGGRRLGPLEPWKAALLSAPSVTLADGGGRIPTGAIKRIIGPLDCPEAVRVLADRFTKNWTDRAFLASCSDADLAAAFRERRGYSETADRLTALRTQYAS